jgi:aminoglycoside phosphotransferase (APT) family kinase protein
MGLNGVPASGWAPPTVPLLDRRQIVAPEVAGLLREAGRPHLRLLSWRWTTALVHGSALLFGCRGRYLDRTSEEREIDFVVKLYPEERYERAVRSYRALIELHRSGFRAPGRLRVPRPYGCSPLWRFILQERAIGAPWVDRLLGEEHERQRASRQAALWLLRLQRSPVLDWPPAPEDEVARTRRYAEELAMLYPKQAPVLQTAADEIVRRLEQSQPVIAAHGDFHPKNVLIAGDVVTAIDFDAAARRDPAFDPGYAIGQTLMMPFFWGGTEAMSLGADAASTFWRTYQDGGGKAEEPRLTTYIVRTILQALHYACWIKKRRLKEGLAPWPRLIAEWLEDGCPQIHGAPSRRAVRRPGALYHPVAGQRDRTFSANT